MFHMVTDPECGGTLCDSIPPWQACVHFHVAGDGRNVVAWVLLCKLDLTLFKRSCFMSSGITWLLHLNCSLIGGWSWKEYERNATVCDCAQHSAWFCSLCLIWHSLSSAFSAQRAHREGSEKTGPRTRKWPIFRNAHRSHGHGMSHVLDHRACVQAWRADQSNEDETPRPAPGWIDATHGVPHTDFVATKLVSATELCGALVQADY